MKLWASFILYSCDYTLLLTWVWIAGDTTSKYLLGSSIYVSITILSRPNEGLSWKDGVHPYDEIPETLRINSKKKVLKLFLLKHCLLCFSFLCFFLTDEIHSPTYQLFLLHFKIIISPTPFSFSLCCKVYTPSPREAEEILCNHRRPSRAPLAMDKQPHIQEDCPPGHSWFIDCTERTDDLKTRLPLLPQVALAVALMLPFKRLAT